ncbi:MAG: methyl-accepting chemotaxis protein [Gammaproteobacteria bacterium]|nr:methyl-accepting chemotaxis protein [Gammaproteobacteria bacterium]
MKKVLGKLSIIQLTLLISALLLTFVFTLLVQNLTNKWQEVDAVNSDLELVTLLDALEKVAHNHAVERGLTAGYLGSGSDEAKRKVLAQRQKADASIQTLRQVATEMSSHGDKVKNNLQVLFQHNSAKNTTRQQVDRQQAPNAFVYYSNLNKIALDVAYNLKNQVQSPAIAKQLSVAFLYARYKERLGQNRGKINGALAKKSLPAAARADIKLYNSDMAMLNQYLEANLVGESAKRFAAIWQTQESRKIQSVTQTLLNSSNINFATLPSPDEWFPMATQQIGEIKKLLDNQWLTVRQTGNEQKQAVQASLITTAVLFVIALVIIISLNIYLLRNLRFELKQLTSMLLNAERGDLTVNMKLDTKDELGEISNAIHNTIYAFKDLMQGLDESVKAGTVLNENMNNATQTVLEDSNKTQSMATNIAAAIEEMAATSQEIANSASDTLQSSDALNQQANLLIEDNKSSQESIEELADSMSGVKSLASQMEQQVTSITSILDSIKSIAEQTNLLALNAAIEAARAGEHGRGFAVVADEVRSLAGNSKESSEKIASLLGELQSISEQVVRSIVASDQLSQAALERFAKAREISDQVYASTKELESLAMNVSSAAEEQSAVAANIASDAANVMDLANHELEASEQLERIFKDMKLNSSTIQNTMDNFKFQ